MNSHTVTDGPPAHAVVDVINPNGSATIVLVCEHASNFIPAHLNRLGLSEEAAESHIAWDLGALAVARALSSLLDAPLVGQQVSRLVYDCNRSPDADSAIPEVSEVYRIPGNAALSEESRTTRARHYYEPFRTALAACLDRAVASGTEPALVTVHSFTPVFNGNRRTTDLGVIHDRDTRLADALLDTLTTESNRDIRRNAPYGPADGVTHTLVEHALSRGLRNVMIEIRNDLIGDPAGQDAMAAWLAPHLLAACEKVLDDPVFARTDGG